MFSATTEYALRSLVRLAHAPPGASVLGHALSEQARIPANYLSKILWALRNAGYLETTRGHGGGYRLARPADAIRLIEIVRLFEGARAEPGCLLGESRDCSDETACSAHEAWKKVKQSYLHFLHHTTIADIGRRPGRREAVAAASHGSKKR